ncbi:hypothetical protein MPER_11629, partial [Moniliophthora perniciosa FA553]
FSSDGETSSTVSSAASSPAPIKVDLPSEEEKPYIPPPTKYRPPFRPQTAQTSSRPEVDPSKATVTRYMYEGGQTGVITGGVMLGSSSATLRKPRKPKTTAPDSPHRPAMRKRSGGRAKILLGPDADSDDDWRRRRSSARV